MTTTPRPTATRCLCCGQRITLVHRSLIDTSTGRVMGAWMALDRDGSPHVTGCTDNPFTRSPEQARTLARHIQADLERT